MANEASEIIWLLNNSLKRQCKLMQVGKEFLRLIGRVENSWKLLQVSAGHKIWHIVKMEGKTNLRSRLVLINYKNKICFLYDSDVFLISQRPGF